MSWFSSDDQLLSMIKNQDNETVKSIIKNRNLYDAVDSSRNTLLHYAAEYGNSEIVQFLIDSGSKVDASNDSGETSMLSSFQSDLPCQKVIEILLKAGANIHLRDHDRKSVLQIINSIEWLTEDIRRFEILKVFLEHTTDIFHLNVLFNANEEIIKLLLQTNINLVNTDTEGQTLVHMLAMNAEPGVIEQLRGKNFDVNARDKYGRTPLMCAASVGVVDAVEFLLNEGADIEATNVDRETALYIAVDEFSRRLSTDIEGTVQVLLEHGANVQVETVDDEKPTIFDCFLIDDEIFDFRVVELVLAHSAMQEALGTPITDLIRSKIIASRRFKAYFEDCQRQLSIEIYPSITLIDVLTASERQLERYFRNEELALKLVDFQTSFNYFNKIQSKRVSKAARMVALRKTAVEIVGKLLRVKYDSYPFVFEEIVGYLEERDIENLILIHDEL